MFLYTCIRYKKNIPISRILSHMQFGRSVNKYLKRYSPDVIYLFPPNNTAIYCLRYKRKHKNVKHVVDMWTELMPIVGLENTFIGNLWRNLRDNSLI